MLCAHIPTSVCKSQFVKESMVKKEIHVWSQKNDVNYVFVWLANFLHLTQQTFLYNIRCEVL